MQDSNTYIPEQFDTEGTSYRSKVLLFNTLLESIHAPSPQSSISLNISKKTKFKQKTMIWHAQMILQVLRLKKSNFAWMSRIVIIEIKQPMMDKQMITQETMRVNYALEKQFLMWYLKEEQRLAKSFVIQESKFIEEFRYVEISGKIAAESLRSCSMYLQVIRASSKVERQFYRLLKRKSPLELEKRLGIRVFKAIFCEAFWSLNTISALEQVSSMPLMIVSACAKQSYAKVVKLERSEKLAKDICLFKFMVRFISKSSFCEKLLVPSQLQKGLPLINASLRASNLHSVILRLSSMEGIRQALKQVKMRRATATKVKKAESGEVYPSSLIFQNFSLSENFISPILTKKTKSTRETNVKRTVRMMKNVLFLPIISVIWSYEPVERKFQKAKRKESSEKLRKVLSWMMLKLQGSVALPRVNGAPPGQEGYY